MATFAQGGYGSQSPSNPVYNRDSSFGDPFPRSTQYKSPPLSGSVTLSDVSRKTHKHYVHQRTDGKRFILLGISRHLLNSSSIDNTLRFSTHNARARPVHETNHDDYGSCHGSKSALNVVGQARIQSPEWPCSAQPSTTTMSPTISGQCDRPSIISVSRQPRALMPGVLVNALTDVGFVNCTARLGPHDDCLDAAISTRFRGSQVCHCRCVNESLAACTCHTIQSLSKKTADASSYDLALSCTAHPLTGTYDSSLNSISANSPSPVTFGKLPTMSLNGLLRRLEHLKERHYLSKSPVRDSRKWQAYEYDLRQSVSRKVSTAACSPPKSKTAVGCFLIGNNLCEICNVIVLDRQKPVNTLNHTKHPTHILRCEGLLSSIRDAYDAAQDEIHNHTSAQRFRAFRRLAQAGTDALKLSTLKAILTLAVQGDLGLDPAHVLDNTAKIKALETRKQARYTRILTDIHSGDTQFLRGFGGPIDGARRYLQINKPSGNRRVRPATFPSSLCSRPKENDTNQHQSCSEDLHGNAPADSPKTKSSSKPDTLPLTTRSDDGAAFYSWWSLPQAPARRSHDGMEVINGHALGTSTLNDHQAGLDGLNQYQRQRDVTPPRPLLQQNDMQVQSSPDSWTKHIAIPSHESWVRCVGSDQIDDWIPYV